MASTTHPPPTAAREATAAKVIAIEAIAAPDLENSGRLLQVLDFRGHLVPWPDRRSPPTLDVLMRAEHQARRSHRTNAVPSRGDHDRQHRACIASARGSSGCDNDLA